MGLVAFVVFILIPTAEIAVAIVVADQIGWGWTLLALLGLSILGVLVIRGTFRAAREIATTAQPMSAAPAVGAKAADAGFRLLAGILLVIPGFITGTIGLLLLLPPVRALARIAAGNAMIRRYPSMQTTLIRVRVMTDPGNVIPGQVVDPEQRGPSGDEQPPRSLP
jgi:UPF0716 protein FxsA